MVFTSFVFVKFFLIVVAVLAGRLVDWHPPAMAFIWSLMPRIWGGPQPELTRWSSKSRATHGRTDAASPAAKHEGLTYIVARELT